MNGPVALSQAFLLQVQLAFLCGAVFLSGCESVESWLDRTIAAERHLAGRSEKPHRVAVLSTGQEALLYRIDRIRSAQNSIRIQTFIFADSKTTRLFIHELTRAARRGVEVQILADSMFSEQSAVYAARAAAAHPRVRFRAFNPVTESLESGVAQSLWTAGAEFRRINRRMHNKVMVVDERWGVCGGRNYDDEYFDEDTRLVYRDRDVAVEGPVVMEMVRSFDDYWNNSASVPIEDLVDVKDALAKLPRIKRDWPFSFADLEIEELADRSEALLRRGEPRLTWHDVQSIAFWADPVGKPNIDDSIVTRLIGALGNARHRLLLQTPYLVFTNPALKLFGMLDDDVTVTIHTNSLASTDNWASYAHSMRQRFEMIKKLGLDVREMKPYPGHLQTIVPGYPAPRTGKKGPLLSLHAKSMVVDDRLAIIGSYNLDPRSETLNTEVLLEVWDRDVASLLAKQIEVDCRPQNSWVVAPKQRALATSLVLGLLERVNAMVKNTTTFDLWPIQSCALFDIKPDAAAVSRFEDEFYESYVDVGQFPGVSSTKEAILVRLARSLTGVFRSQM